MRALATILCFLVPVSFLSAGEEAPVKRRPRIRVYDQQAEVVPVIQPVDESADSKNDFDKKIRGESGVSSTVNPVDMVSFIPTLNTGAQNSSSENADEEGEESWITPMDLLAEEDRMAGEELDLSVKKEGATEGEMEILDWEGLQKSMVEDALKNTRPEMSEEDIEEMLNSRTEDPLDSSGTGGLEMEDVAPLQDLATEQENLGEGRFLETSGDAGDFVPVLPSARQMDGEIYKPQRDRNVQLELSGSRGMLNDLKEKWTKPSAETAVSRSAAFELPGMSRSTSLPGASVREVSMPGFSANNPAVSRQPLVQKPAILAPVRQEAPVAQPRTDPGSVRRNDYRLRSQLGVSSGL